MHYVPDVQAVQFDEQASFTSFLQVQIPLLLYSPGAQVLKQDPIL